MEVKRMNFTKLVRTTLLKVANKDSAKHQEGYMKNVIKFHGLKAPIVEKCWKDTLKSNLQTNIPELKDQVDVSYELIASKYFEEKSIGIKILASNVKNFVPKKKKKSTEDDEIGVNGLYVVNGIEENLFDKEHVYDWATCDTISSTVICELIKRDSSLAQVVQKWKDSDNLWKQRSACVSFVKIAKHGEYNDLIIDICSTTVKNSERFAQLGTGWVLRELSLADLDLVTDFIKENYSHFSREGLRYAVEKMSKDDKEELMSYEP
ncbi:predicted protein [Naegleria gruberi]|uniref:Predicted protein n=1 Tax=Naegleria gruberi TaxID=5762 RepID=D2W338_NAEGR|nr:uncharacterized protein NAEGRDRAFT_82313 [Naegleria gruberi]XP_002669290.1 uncharacterized protein NAEGRDRAFT_75809 [Naegleria gruberi]EFC36046.1 hypothetical protein NAEGRDRAFT_82313 [Naegleria gruberi]EFC36546.1 predicted protein [Naegleria gruberi]|eukprot:XP_002668790.1 hypothetical protein NAEGRDRAFT_82313 [Naegleria gruberi strain NEG-M]